MRELIISILGEYAPNLAPDGSVLGGLYSLDLTWIFGAFCFALMLYFTLVFLRIVFCGFFGGRVR